MKHGGGVNSAQFSPDGKRIVTASDDGVAQVWDIAPFGTGFPNWLLPLAEAVSGRRLNPQGVLEATGQDPATVIGRIRQQLDQAPTNDDWVVWGRWFLADRATRTISPFSKVTVPEHLHNLADLLYAKGDYAEAESLYRRALEGRERKLGKEHPDTAKSRNMLIEVLTKAGKSAEAEALRREAGEAGNKK